MASARPLPDPAVIATVFVDIVGFAMILPLLPELPRDRMGSSPTSIGLLVGAYSLLQFLLAPLWGRAQRPRRATTGHPDRHWPAACCRMLLFAVADSFALLLLSRVLDGGSGASINVAQAYLADLRPEAQRARAMGIVGAAVGVGFIVGPILGGITAGISPMLPGLLAAAITAINLLVAVVILPESRQRRRAAVPKATIPLSWGTLLPAMSVIFLATLAFSVMYVVFPLFGEQRLGATRSTVSYWFAFVGLVTAIVQGGLLGRLVRWLGDRGRRAGCGTPRGRLPPGGAVGQGGGDHLGVLAALASLGAGFGMAGAAMTGLVSRRTRQDAQGSILGVMQSASAMSRVVGPIVAGAVMELRSPEAAFGASAAMAVAACLLAFGVARPDPADDGLSPGR
jgi:MFS transporter, DHA1 family, tetracycline resistance protein